MIGDNDNNDKQNLRDDIRMAQLTSAKRCDLYN